MGVSENSGTPKSSILIGISIINHPIWGTPFFWKHPYRPVWYLGKRCVFFLEKNAADCLDSPYFHQFAMSFCLRYPQRIGSWKITSGSGRWHEKETYLEAIQFLVHQLKPLVFVLECQFGIVTLVPTVCTTGIVKFQTASINRWLAFSGTSIQAEVQHLWVSSRWFSCWSNSLTDEFNTFLRDYDTKNQSNHSWGIWPIDFLDTNILSCKPLRLDGLVTIFYSWIAERSSLGLDLYAVLWSM